MLKDFNEDQFLDVFVRGINIYLKYIYLTACARHLIYPFVLLGNFIKSNSIAKL